MGHRNTEKNLSEKRLIVSKRKRKKELAAVLLITDQWEF